MFRLDITDDQKRAFALALLDCNGDAYKAGFRTFPNNTGLALGAGTVLPRDPIVIEVMAAAAVDKLNLKEGLASKEELGRKLLALVDECEMYNPDKPANEAKDRISALRLYAEIMGFIEKPSIVNNNQVTNTVAKVLVVKRWANQDEYEQAAIAQQAKLVNDSSADI